MFAFIKKVVRSMFPTGQPWRLNGLSGDLIDALSMYLGRVKAFAFLIIRESQPISSVTMIRQWYEAFDLIYDPNLPIADLQARVSQVYTSIGGQGVDYINEQVQRAFPDVTVVEYLVTPFDFMVGIGMTGRIVTSSYESWIPLIYRDGTYPVFLYKVEGSVSSVDDLRRLGDILQKVVPATHEAIFDSSIIDIPETAMAGLARVGLARAGRIG